MQEELNQFEHNQV